MRVLVTGGRDYADRATFYFVMDQLHAVHGFDCVIHGAARGADALADAWAEERGVVRLPFKADWRGDQKQAGPIRNSRMVHEGKPDMVVEFVGGAGTADCVRKALAARVPVYEAATGEMKGEVQNSLFA